LINNARNKIKEAMNSCKTAQQYCPSSCNYRQYLNDVFNRLKDSGQNIARISPWFDLLKNRYQKNDEDSQERIEKIEDTIIKKHDIYVK